MGLRLLLIKHFGATAAEIVKSCRHLGATIVAVREFGRRKNREVSDIDENCRCWVFLFFLIFLFSSPLRKRGHENVPSDLKDEIVQKGF